MRRAISKSAVFKIDIEGDQKFSGADHAGAGSGMKRGFAKIRQALGITAYFFAQSFRSGRGGRSPDWRDPARRAAASYKIDRNVQFAPYALAQLRCQACAELERHARNRN